MIDLTPQPLQHVFLADSGSVSVEVALKMALQYQRGIGRPERHQMLTIKGGYHGDTFGAMSVCDPAGGMHSMWSAILPEQVLPQATRTWWRCRHLGPGAKRSSAIQRRLIGGVDRRASPPRSRGHARLRPTLSAGHARGG
ncbi:MAG: aminotransferase class III-fold pyridoxal phosphate-dependent enzyme [Marmoricola sp.]